MSKRKAITERMKIDALLWLAWSLLSDGRIPIKCAICGDPIPAESRIEWDHIQPVSAGGEHHYTNIRPVHYDCHKKKTFHPRSKATTLGGDNFEAKKAGRIARGGKKKKGPKIQSRPFPKQSRPFTRQSGKS